MNQTEKVKEHLDRYGSITTLEAFNDYGITRLSARIHELRTDGYPIDREFKNVKNRYGERVSVCIYKKSQTT